MRLKLIDKETGKPVTGADVSYWPIYPNPHVREVPGYAPVRGIGAYNSGIRQDDGTYLLGVLPGPGGVFVRTAEGLYRPACVDPEAFFKAEDKKDPRQRPARPRRRHGRHLHRTRRRGNRATRQSQYSAIVLVNPAEDSGPLSAEAVLERDQKREVRVLGPDGEPLTGVTAEGDGAETTKTPGVLTVSKLNPHRPKRFTFRHAGQEARRLPHGEGDETEPYTVKLQPWGTITGRLVDAEGKPRPGVHLMTSDWQAAMIDPARGVLPSGQKTDADGRFRFEGLVPGQEYSGNAVGEQAAKRGFGVVIDRVVLKPGETRDLGDVRARKPNRRPRRDSEPLSATAQKTTSSRTKSWARTHLLKSPSPHRILATSGEIRKPGGISLRRDTTVGEVRKGRSESCRAYLRVPSAITSSRCFGSGQPEDYRTANSWSDSWTAR